MTLLHYPCTKCALEKIPILKDNKLEIMVNVTFNLFDYIANLYIFEKLFY